MNQGFFKKIIVFVCLLFVFDGFSDFASAQSAGLNIKPAIIEDRADPGEQYSFRLKVTNVSSEEKVFYLTTQNINGLTSDGLPIFSEEAKITPYELSSWVVIPEESITLGGGESREIPFTVKVPENASPGAHFGGVFLDFRPPELRESGAGVGYKVGSIIHLRISGEVIEEARLREFSTEKTIYNLAEVNFKSTVENLGNVLIRPRGILEITDMWGRQVANMRVNDNGNPVFPRGERAFDIQWKNDGFTFGRHQAVLSLIYGEDSRKTISAAVSFWILPLKPLGIALGSVVGLILLIFMMIKMHIRKKLREMAALSNIPNLKPQDSLYYKQQKMSPRLTIIIAALLLFLFAFSVVLFFLFA